MSDDGEPRESARSQDEMLEVAYRRGHALRRRRKIARAGSAVAVIVVLALVGTRVAIGNRDNPVELQTANTPDTATRPSTPDTTGLAPTSSTTANPTTTSGTPTPTTAPAPSDAGGMFTSVCAVDEGSSAPLPSVAHPQSTYWWAGRKYGVNGTGAGTTCKRTGDVSTYAGRSFVIGQTQGPMGPNEDTAPKSAWVIYTTGRHDVRSVQAIPSGLVMVATENLEWTCGDVATPATPSANAPTCATGDLGLKAWFPDCWNGTDVDSADHRSHVAFSTGGACPSDHPVAIPRLGIEMRYGPSKGGPVTFRNVDPRSGEAPDELALWYQSGWDAPSFDQLLNGCLRAGKDCKQDNP